MSVSSRALCSLDNVKDWGNITGSRDLDDTLLENLIDRITDMFETYCGVTSFKQATYTEYYDGSGDRYLFVKNIPINSITNIWDDADWNWTSSDLVDSDDYRIVKSRYIAHLSYWNAGIQNIKITYNAGYSTIPGDLQQACIEEVLRKYTRRKEIDVVRKDIPDGGYDVVKPGLLSSTVMTLQKYRPLRAY